MPVAKYLNVMEVYSMSLTWIFRPQNRPSVVVIQHICRQRLFNAGKPVLAFLSLFFLFSLSFFLTLSCCLALRPRVGWTTTLCFIFVADFSGRTTSGIFTALFVRFYNHNSLGYFFSNKFNLFSPWKFSPAIFFFEALFCGENLFLR